MSTYDELLAALTPTLWWKLADAVDSTTTADSSGNGHTGTVAGGVTFGETGPVLNTPADTAALFNGSNGTSTASLSLSGFGTAIVWYKTTSSAELVLASTVYSVSIGWVLVIDSGDIICAVDNGSHTADLSYTAVATNDGDYHMAALTFDGTTAILYIDGAEVASGGVAGAMPADLGTIAAGSANGEGFFDGTLAQLAVLDSVVSADNVAALYAAANQAGYTTYTPPIIPLATPRWTEHSTPQQKALYKYMRPLDLQCNTFVLSDGSVVTDYPAPIANGGTSSTNIPYPWDPAGAPASGPPNGSSGVPQGQPFQPYAYVSDPIDPINPRQYQWEYPNAPTDNPGETFTTGPGIVYWFQGGVGSYHNLPASVISTLLAAGFEQYLS